MKTTLISFFALTGICFQASAQVAFKGLEHLFTPPLTYVIGKTTEPLQIDGNLTEASWQAAPWSESFVDIEGSKKEKPALQTRFKMLWDENNLYIAATLEDPHIWASLKQHDAIIFLDNDFEVFIDPDGDTHNYFEIEVNALKTTFDLFLNKPYRNGGEALVGWEVPGLQTGIQINGSLNNPADTDKSWTIEMAAPFSAVHIGYNVKHPQPGTVWRLNFSRVQWDTDIINNEYRKKTNAATGKPLPEHNWVWSPQGIINMHYPERWGYVQFTEEKTGNKPQLFQIPLSEKIKNYLWLIYYRQHQFYSQNKRFAQRLKELDFASSNLTENDEPYTLLLEATSKQFLAVIKNVNTKEGWQINEEGEIKKF